MKNKNIILIISMLLTCLSASAQSGYFLSFLDYFNDTWQPLDTLQMEQRNSGKFWWGGCDIKPVTGNKKTDKLLKKKARLICHADSLYINCRQLSCQGVRFGNWYAPAYIYERDYFLFIAPSFKSRQRISNIAFMFGAVGGVIATSTSKHDYMCYVFNPGTELVEPVDKTMMERLLEEYPELHAKLMQVKSKERYTPEVVMPILQELGLITGNGASQK